jgi:hypothetical protein
MMSPVIQEIENRVKTELSKEQKASTQNVFEHALAQVEKAKTIQSNQDKIDRIIDEELKKHNIDIDAPEHNLLKIELMFRRTELIINQFS